MKNKKILIILIFIFFLNSCSILNYEIVGTGEQEKIIKKLDNLTTKVNNLEEELKIFRKENLQVFVEKNIKTQVIKKLKELKEEELKSESDEIKKIQKQNKMLEEQNKKIDEDIAKTKTKIISGKYCVFDTCMYEKGLEIEGIGNISEILKDKNFFINLVGKDCKPQDYNNKNEKCLLASKMSESKSFLLKNLRFKNKKESIYINQFLDFFIKTNITKQDKNIKIFQQIFSKKGENLDNKQAQKFFNSDFNLFKNNFKINSLEFEISPNVSNIDEINTKLFLEKKLISTEEIKQIIKQDILKNKKTYKNYIFPIDKEKAIYISYILLNKTPEKLIYLGKDKKWLNTNIKDNLLIDKDLTNKILSYYKDYKILDINNNQIKEFSPNIKPIFEVKKFDENGNYLLYFSKYYVKEKTTLKK